MKPEELREQLLAAAHRTAPLEIDTERVRTRVRRRRVARYAAVTGTGLAVATAVVLNTLPSASPPEPQTPMGSVHKRPPATSGAEPGNTPGAEPGNTPGAPPPLPHYTCGARIPASSGRGTVTVRVSGVAKAPDGTPRVSYAVTATAPTVLSGRPRILVLKDGRVVAGQDPAGPPATHPPGNENRSETGSENANGNANGNGDENTARRTPLTPDRPQRAQLAPVPGRPCPGTTWNSMWKDGYEVAVVLPTEPTEHATPPGTRAPDALIVARTPLTE
ncbi:hypothetical protein [Streptomyces sp. NPDC059649]|uniref:hypothetical protein n=1 Tax=Streptomyces sp. NPDC059649 TaxID=3346895 RepID=UPI0036A29E4B